MRQAFLALIASTLALAAGIPAACAAPGSGESAETAPGRLDWKIDTDETRRSKGEIKLALSRRTAGTVWLHSNTRPIAGLIGLTMAELGSDSGRPVSFVLDREAGAFVCEGTAKRWRGAGQCVFHANAGFAFELADRGYGAPSESQQFSLAVQNIGRLFIDELARQEYARPTIADLVRAGDHGVGLEYLKKMGGHGYRVGTLAALVDMRDHGVSPDYISELARLGIRDLPADEVVRLRDHGVTAAFISALRAAGYSLPPGQLVRLRDHGVSSEYIRELKELGYTDLTVEDLVRLRAHGVSAEFIRRVNAAGGRRNVAELVAMRARGSTGN